MESLTNQIVLEVNRAAVYADAARQLADRDDHAFEYQAREAIRSLQEALVLLDMRRNNR